MLGNKYGNLVVVEEHGKTRSGDTLYICKCDCGNLTHPISGMNLRKGHTQSCGCKKTKHGQWYSRLYWVWCAMKKRCYNAKHPTFKNYGGRGITVCDEWLNSFPAFAEWAMANGYKPDARQGECTLDRIDTNGNYCPDNCRWVSMKVQQNNRRNNVKR